MALIAIALAAPATAATFEEDACAGDAREAIAAARHALEDDSNDDRAALACLIEAVAALDDKIQGLADGSMPFEGQIYAPKGVVMVKPSDQEGR